MLLDYALRAARLLLIRRSTVLSDLAESPLFQLNLHDEVAALPLNTNIASPNNCLLFQFEPFLASSAPRVSWLLGVIFLFFERSFIFGINVQFRSVRAGSSITNFLDCGLLVTPSLSDDAVTVTGMGNVSSASRFSCKAK